MRLQLFAHLWNYLAMFAEFFINLFIDPTYAVKKLIYDLVKSGIDMMSSLAGSFDSAADILAKVFVTAANIAIGGINALISAMNLTREAHMEALLFDYASQLNRFRKLRW